MSWVYVYLLAFQVTLAKCQLITEESWRQTYLDPEDTFANHSIMSAYSRLECAAKALSLEWPNLFCYDSPKKECLLSDLVTISAQKTSEDQVSCLTRFNDNKGIICFILVYVFLHIIGLAQLLAILILNHYNSVTLI